MDRYINADKMIADTEAMRAVSEAITIDGIIKYINEHAITDVQEVKHAHWEDVNIDYDVQCNMVTMWCPVCKKWHSKVYVYGNPTENINYCSYCGAIMNEKENKE